MLTSLTSQLPVFWINPRLKDTTVYTTHFPSLSLEAVHTAKALMVRFEPLLQTLFPELKATQHIASSTTTIETFQKSIVTFVGGSVPGKWMIKNDYELPISGSIKARGGMYALLKYAEDLATEAGLINHNASYEQFASAKFTALFSQYTVMVSSTGNLGLSIGIIGKRLGFDVTVHMSQDAKPWKVEKLRALGVHVIQHEGTYTDAVKIGRESALKQEKCYFIDDENSKDLFTGYSIAGFELKAQLEAQHIHVDEKNPLFVYLPCGVGGAPSGIAYTLKACFGKGVHLFFAEPTAAPCMLLGLSTEKMANADITQLGLTGQTIADGLAVGTPSALACDILSQTASGGYTVSDAVLQRMQYLLFASENIALEPSALASFAGPYKLFYTKEGFDYLKAHGLLEYVEQIHHISWATGGSMVPHSIMHEDLKKGQDSNINIFD